MQDRSAFKLNPEQAEYHHNFQGSREMQGFLTWLRTHTLDYIARRETPKTLDFIQTGYERGCSIRIKEFGYNLLQCLSIAECLKDNALDYGYRLYMSDRFRKGTQSIFRHYLKAPLSREQGKPQHQLFGNLTIQAHTFGDEPRRLSIFAKGYPGKAHIHDESLADLIHMLAKG